MNKKPDTEAADTYKHRDILIPLDDPWTDQTRIDVIGYSGELHFFIHSNYKQVEILKSLPASKRVFIKPKCRSTEFKTLQRIENITSSEVGSASNGRLKLDTVIGILKDRGFERDITESTLRWLVGNGTLIASETKARRPKIELRLSQDGREAEDRRVYASSFANELSAQSQQIGRLIGHGPTVGSEREELLRALIERHVPSRYHVATGFVEGSSRQIDILIYDQVDFAPLFRAGNLVVVPGDAVRALIEVKSNLSRAELLDSLAHLAEARPERLIGPPAFTGVFGYDGASSKTLIKAIQFHHRETGPDDYEPAQYEISTIHDMITAVCVLQKSLLMTGFLNSSAANEERVAPAVVEMGSEAGRSSQASIFFDLLMRHLRYPFTGPLQQLGRTEKIATDIIRRNGTLIYGPPVWSVYAMGDEAIELTKKNIAAHSHWINGNEWVEPRDRS